MKPAKTTGAAIAATAAIMLVSGAGLSAPASAGNGKVKCYGVNACKGKSACATATSSCAGHNACKGKGWIKLTAADCKAKGGTTK